jgi:hypothetical protein
MVRQSRKWLLAPLGLLSLTGVLAASASAPSVTSGWVTVASSPSALLFDVSCPTTTDCWAVGVGTANQSAIEHYNGSTWSIVTSPNAGTTDELTGVACAGAGDCWAVGLTRNGSAQGDLIEHYTGSVWTLVTGPGAGLIGVTCVTSTNCWATGSVEPGTPGGAAIEHYDGVSWSVATSPTPVSHDGYALGRVRCYGASNCWAVGEGSPVTSSSQALAEHYNGAAWSLVAVPDAAVNEVLYDVACTSAGTCWALGCDSASPSVATCDGSALVERYSGSSWTVAASPTASSTSGYGDLACATASDCWIIGIGANGAQNVTEHDNGAGWSINASTVNATAVTCFASGACWAVGHTITRYTPPATPPSSTPTATTPTRVTLKPLPVKRVTVPKGPTPSLQPGAVTAAATPLVSATPSAHAAVALTAEPRQPNGAPWAPIAGLAVIGTAVAIALVTSAVRRRRPAVPERSWFDGTPLR